MYHQNSSDHLRLANQPGTVDQDSQHGYMNRSNEEQSNLNHIHNHNHTQSQHHDQYHNQSSISGNQSQDAHPHDNNNNNIQALYSRNPNQHENAFGTQQHANDQSLDIPFYFNRSSQQSNQNDVLAKGLFQNNFNSHNGTISAPATTEMSDDYFSFVGLESLQERENEDARLDFQNGEYPQAAPQFQYGFLNQNQNQSQNSVPFFGSANEDKNALSSQPQIPHNLTRSASSHVPSRTARRRTFSAQRPHLKSNLSMSYSGFVNQDVAVMSPETSNNNSDDAKNNNYSTDSYEQASRKKNRNPGFRIKLDDLGPKSKKSMGPSTGGSVGHSGNMYVSPGASQRSESVQNTPSMRTGFKSPILENFQVYSSHDMYGGELILAMSASAKLDFGQETVTPLMYPPQTDNRDYFGEYSEISAPGKTDSLQMSHEAIYNSSKIENHTGSLSTRLNAGYNEYANLNDFQPLLTKRSYDQSSNRDEFYYENANSDDHKVEAQFTPVGFDGFSATNLASTENGMEFQTYNQGDNALNYYNTRNMLYGDGQEQAEDEMSSLHEPKLQYKTHTSGLNQKKLLSPFRNEFELNYETFNGKSEEEWQVFQSDGTKGNTKANPKPRLKKTKEQSLPQEDGDDSVGATVTKKKAVKGTMCTICDKFISRDYSRHMRIHDQSGRFQCVFPAGFCNHKSRKFNRPYDYKKHLLNVHFKFNDSKVKLEPNLTEKLHVEGKCTACGASFVASEWLDDHIMSEDFDKRCHKLQEMMTQPLNDAFAGRSG